MFRASDVFGRRPGQDTNPVTWTTKRNLASSYSPTSTLTSRTWDPSTGQYYDEDMPPEVLEMMAMKKKAKILSAPDDGSAWGNHTKASGGVLTTGAVKKETHHKVGPAAPISNVDTSVPSVEYQGFSKVDLNDRYYEKASLMLHGKPSYWNEDKSYFIYWQGEVQRWAICDGSSYTAIKAGQYPGWAYKDDHRHFSLAGGWLEAFNGTWEQPDLEVITRSFSSNKPQWDDSMVQKSITVVEFRGFAMQELNTRYRQKPGEIIQGRPTYWDDSGVYFIYFQRDMNRWAICDLKCLDAVRSGQCPGWAYRSDSSHFANACGWMEQRQGDWAQAILETGVVATCAKGLKVELSGFMKEELNTQYSEKDEEVQGKATFWDANEAFFIYWQSSYGRWAICDSVSLGAAQKGLSPGWAFRGDSKHFAKASGWMESYGRDWKPAHVQCTVLEGTVREDWGTVKAEIKEEMESATNFSAEQYADLLGKLYLEKHPSKLEDLTGFLDRFEGREKVLYDMVCKKYSVNGAAFAEKHNVVEASGVGNPNEAAGGEDEHSLHENEELPNLSARQLAIRVQHLYVLHNSKKLEDLPRLLAKYRNREKQLYLEVCKKYEINATKFHYKCVEEGLDN